MIDLILHHAHIITLNPHRPHAEALAIAQGRIVAIGNNDDILNLATARTQLQHAGGACIIPGLTDAHLHWEWTTLAMNSLDLMDIPSKEATLMRIREGAAALPAGEWLTGWGWAHGMWSADGALPSAQDLDPITGDIPTYFSARSGHAGWANTAALRASGISASTPDPDGGEIVRDAQGNPTGILLETAMKLVQVPKRTPEQLAQAMLKTQAKALAAGLTGFHDFDNPSCMAALEIQRERGQLHMRVVKQINQAWFESALALGIRSNMGDEWLKFGGLKLFADGALGARTAWMVEPYEGEPHNRGIVVVPKDLMHEWVIRATLAGLSSTIHAIGDQAVRDVLDIYAEARRVEAEQGIRPDQRRHRIEHVQIIHPDDKARLADLKVIGSFQPIHATSDYEVADKFWGARSRWAYNARLQLDQGVICAFGSDSPVEPFEPFKGIHAAVTRQRADGTPVGGWYPELRLTLEEALHGYTTGAAYAAYAEDRLGRLAEGYYADLVLLDVDPFSLDASALLDIKVLGTMVGGAWRYGGL